MARTHREVLEQARVLLQDNRSPYRYSDLQLLANLKEALGELWRLRPDAFYGQLAIDYIPPTGWDEDLPVEAVFFTPIVNFVVARAEMRDDEFVNDNRAGILYAAFQGAVRGR
jgi:hypothetical protein